MPLTQAASGRGRAAAIGTSDRAEHSRSTVRSLALLQAEPLLASPSIGMSALLQAPPPAAALPVGVNEAMLLGAL